MGARDGVGACRGTVGDIHSAVILHRACPCSKASGQNTVPSATIGSGEGPPGGRSASAIFRPALQVPPCSICGIVNALIEAEFAPYGVEQLVHERHGQRAPFDDDLRGHLVGPSQVDRLTRTDHAEIDQQTAVAIFRQGGEFVEPGHGQSCMLDRFEERIGQPLRQLVKRHDLVGVVAGANRRVAARIADGDAAQHQARRPDRRQAVEQRGEDRRRRNAIAAERAQKIIDQIAGTRRRRAEQVGTVLESCPRGGAAAGCAAPVQPMDCPARPENTGRGTRARSSQAPRRPRATGDPGRWKIRLRQTCRGSQPRALRNARTSGRLPARDNARRHRRRRRAARSRSRDQSPRAPARWDRH